MTKNVFQKLSEVRKAVSYLKKEKSGSQYSYVGSSDVLGSLHSTINEQGLLIIPSIKNHKVTERVEVINNKGQNKERITYFTELDMNMRWQNIDDKDDYIDCSWYAQGIDIAGEKGVGKALTYGEKYFLLKFFNIATDKDDPDTFQQRQEAKKPAALINGKQLAEMNDLIRQVSEASGTSISIVTNELLKSTNFSNLNQVTEDLYSPLLSTLTIWNKKYRTNNSHSQQEEVKKSSIAWGQRA